MNYHISALGDDRADGTELTPWQTLDRLQSAPLKPGDCIRLDSRTPHRGSLILRNQHGTARQPIVVSSYGSEEPAVIEADDAIAILLWNSSGIRIEGLHLMGAGHPRNQTHGLCLFADETNPESESGDIEIYSLEIERFGCAGLAVGGKNGRGLKNVSVRSVRCHDNAYAGIFIFGATDDPIHQNISIDACEAYDNPGVPGLLHINGHGHHSGHGILMSCVSGGTIENSRAFRNGTRNTAHICGPAGIWASNSHKILICGNESFENRTAGATDGGGFGFDGGMRDSLMQDNFSHDNDGSGFLMAQYYGARPFSGNRFVGNRSENDCRHNDNGAIHIWCPTESNMSDLLIEGNEVHVTCSPRGRPRAFVVDAVTDGLKVVGNRFVGLDLPMLLEVSIAQTAFLFTGNTLSGSGALRWRGQVYKEVARWLEVFPQELHRPNVHPNLEMLPRRPALDLNSPGSPS